MGHYRLIGRPEGGGILEKLNLKPTHKPVAAYFQALAQFKSLNVSHESAVRAAFQNLLEACARQFGWALVAEWTEPSWTIAS